ncbi:MAG TPA: penicillin-binding protein [Bryobacteraceae bacterium]|jgi:cell division protein FtsI (penicillin-binding protein 3)|nr:penicillin-binding protein [Bryobacteraceae bacterium]
MIERRLTILAAILVLWGGAIFVKLLSLQVLHHREYVQLAHNREELDVAIPAPRGTIFDRHGQPLAMSVPTESVYVNPLKVPDLDVASTILSLALHMDRQELFGKLKWASDTQRGFLWVKRKITFEEGQSVRNLRLDWIQIQSESQRHYPNGALAAALLGSVDFEEKGNAGIERSFDSELRGKPGRVRLLTDVNRRGIDSQMEMAPHAGTPLTLTIEERLQFVAEREIATAVKAHEALSGSVVVMNPQNGEILAMASYPPYDPNDPPQPGEKSARQNHALSVPFEPGSVFKVITLSAALETTSLRPESPIDCHGGVLRLPGRVIHDSHIGMGVVPMATVLAKSSNIGAIEVGMRVGQPRMYDYVRKFGFGQKTGLELPAESGGKLRKLGQWGTTSLASISMGQEVSVTTVQLARAASVIANGGLLIKPHIIFKRGGQAVQPPVPIRIVKPETAITMRQMMEGVVLPGGTGYPRARLEGYSVGGKTGSAQIYDVASRHYTHTYNGSFMGFAPLTNPAIVVVVTLNGTHGTAGFGGQAAAPVFHAVATEALRVMDVPRDLPDQTPPPAQLAKKAEVDDLSIADIGSDQPNILEEGDEEGETAPAGPRVPNFRGMTMRAVLATAAAQGLTIVPGGSGVARMQSPPAGSLLHEGERIRVQFVR